MLHAFLLKLRVRRYLIVWDALTLWLQFHTGRQGAVRTTIMLILILASLQVGPPAKLLRLRAHLTHSWMIHTARRPSGEHIELLRYNFRLVAVHGAGTHCISHVLLLIIKLLSHFQQLGIIVRLLHDLLSHSSRAR